MKLFFVAFLISSSAFAQTSTLDSIKSRISSAYQAFRVRQADEAVLRSEIGLFGADAKQIDTHIKILESQTVDLPAPVKADMLARANRLRLVERHRGFPVTAPLFRQSQPLMEQMTDFRPIRNDLIRAHLLVDQLEFDSPFLKDDVKAAHDPAYEKLGCKVAMTKLIQSKESLATLQNRAIRDHFDTVHGYPKSERSSLPRSLTERAVLCDAYHLIIDGRHIRAQNEVLRDDEVFKTAKGLK